MSEWLKGYIPGLDGVTLFGYTLGPAVAKSAFHQIQLIAQLCLYLEDKCLTMVHALLISKTDDCQDLFVGLSLKSA